MWVDFSRRGARGRAPGMRTLLDADELAACGPVVAELLAGADGEVAERFWEMLSSLPWAQLDPAAWREVGATARRLHRPGRIFRSPTSRSPLPQLARVTPCGVLIPTSSASVPCSALWSYTSTATPMAEQRLPGARLNAPARRPRGRVSASKSSPQTTQFDTVQLHQPSVHRLRGVFGGRTIPAIALSQAKEKMPSTAHHPRGSSRRFSSHTGAPESDPTP